MNKHLLTSLLLTLLFTSRAGAQSILEQPIIVQCRQQPVGRVLEFIAGAGRFYFSYTGTLFNKDSLVTLPQQTRTVRQTLDLLFKGRLQYRENGRYLILLPATDRTASPATALPPDKSRIMISGIILDERTGQKLGDASVYDPDDLVAALSKKDGSFTVRIRNKSWPVLLAVSKEAYIDTIILLQPGSDRELTISISPDAFPPKALLFSLPDHGFDDSIRIEWQGDTALFRAMGNLPLIQVEMTGFGKILLSYRLRIQSINLGKFFTRRPVQLSFVPGLSTNGPMNSQVTNKFSANIIGGYSAGLRGVELGGVFNIDKKKAKGFQAAGVVNLVGDSVSGVQLAGVCNNDLGYVKGFQAAGVFNHARHLKGMQLGLINIADTLDGVQLGLINITRHGMHELSVYADEWSSLNLAYRSGNPKFYTIYLAGLNPGINHRSYYYGFGLGHQFDLRSKLAFRSELSYVNVSPVDLQHFGKNTFVSRCNIDLHWQASKQLAFSAGPSFAFYNPDQNYYTGGRLYQPLSHGYSTFSFSGRAIGWIGWRAAVNLF